MDYGLQGRVALVTGGSSGIGRGIAEILAAEGAVVAVTSRTEAKAAQAAAEIGGGARGYAFDSNDLDAVDPLIDAIVGDLGEIDVYIANTGGPPTGATLDFSPEQWEAANRTLLLSPLAIIKRVLPGMQDRGFGRVVAVGSSTVREPLEYLPLSNTYRPGLVSVFKVLARESAAQGVTFNHVHPGQILTERLISSYSSEADAQEQAKDIPPKRFGTVAEIGAAAVFLCSAQASYVSGSSIWVDGASIRSL